MRRKWLKRLVLTLLIAPVALIFTLIVLLYIPPIQNFLREELTSYASEATGMQINVKHIRLHFPLQLKITDVEVIQQPDTLLSLESLSAGVQLLPLFQGKIQLDNLALREAKINTITLIDGMTLTGQIGEFSAKSHGIDISNEEALINYIHLKDTRLSLLLFESTKDSTTTQSETPLKWQATLKTLQLSNVAFDLQIPSDSMHLSTHFPELAVTNVKADLAAQAYEMRSIGIKDAILKYSSGNNTVKSGFDPSHIALRNVNIELDSLYNKGLLMKGILRNVSFEERSGLTLMSLQGKLHSDSSRLILPDLKLLTPHSEMNLSTEMYWNDLFGNGKNESHLRFDARIDKQDIFLFTGKQREILKKTFPIHPLMAHLVITGGIRQFNLSQMSVSLPGAFSLSGNGTISQITDSLHRSGLLDLKLQTRRLDFICALAGLPRDSSFVIPENIHADIDVRSSGPEYTANLLLKEGSGSARIKAIFNSVTEAYSAGLDVDSMHIDHFLPKDSLRMLSLAANIKGQGTEINSLRTTTALDLKLNKLEYGSYVIDSISLYGKLAQKVATVQLISDNAALTLDATASYALDKSYTEAKATIDIKRIDLKRFGVFPELNAQPFAVHIDANLTKDTVQVYLNTGDLDLTLRARGTLEKLINESSRFVEVLTRQIDEQHLDHAELRRALPSALLRLNMGTKNVVNSYLATQHIRFNTVKADFIATPRIGINGRTTIHSLKYDTLQLDTIVFFTYQDTTHLAFHAGVTNALDNPHISFKAKLEGEIRTKDAGVTLDYENSEGEKGLLFGVTVTPDTGGTFFRFTPEEPIIAFHAFKFNGHNGIFVKKDLRVLADVDILDDEGMGIRIHSVEESDSTYLQNLDVEIRKIQLTDVSRMLPYLPKLSGEIFLEANIKKTAENLQISAEGHIDSLFYERKYAGDIGVGVTWMPGESGKQYIDAYLSSDTNEVMTAGGLYNISSDALNVDVSLTQFPLHLANLFIPEGLLELSGQMNGALSVTGKSEQPRIDGELMFDSASLNSLQYGFNFRFDNRPVQIVNNRLSFDQFAIYSTNDNPFTITGDVDMVNLSNPTLNLSLLARNYQLLKASRTKNRILYGNVFIDMNSTIKGKIDALQMRGHINILGNTDVTYVMLDSPLSVQDRLGDLVEFTSFSDTLGIKEEERDVITIGGIDMLMNININEPAKVNVDLSPDRSSHISLEGGGDLSFQYTPQGDMILTGRYSLTRGTVKYSLPVIPLKEFEINQGSDVQWSGDPVNPQINLKASERVRASVANDDGNSSRMVNFDVSIQIKNKLNELGLVFDLNAPEDSRVQEQLAAMDEAERSKQAVALMVTGTYLAGGSSNNNFNMGTALNSMLQNQIASLAGSALKTANISFDVENIDEGSNKRTDYNFSYSQRLFNDRVRVIIGGRISTGTTERESGTFIDNVSLEYRLDASGTRYMRIYHNKEYENILESDITETGVGIVLRKKVNRLVDLFIFKRKNDE